MHHSRFHLIPDCKQEIWFQPSFLIKSIRSIKCFKYIRREMAWVQSWAIWKACTVVNISTVSSFCYLKERLSLSRKKKIYITDQRALHSIKWWQQAYNNPFNDNLILHSVNITLEDFSTFVNQLKNKNHPHLHHNASKNWLFFTTLAHSLRKQTNKKNREHVKVIEEKTDLILQCNSVKQLIHAGQNTFKAHNFSRSVISTESDDDAITTTSRALASTLRVS